MRRPQNILILNLTRMGDLIQSTPLLIGLRRAYPQARQTLLVGPEFAEFSRRLPEIDERVVFDLKQFSGSSGKKPGFWVRVYRYIESVLDDLAAREFDLVINLSHSKLSALMIAYLGIPEVRGFCCNDEGDRMTEHPWLQYFFTEPFNRAYNTFNLVDIFCRGGDVRPTGEGVQIRTLPGDDAQAEAILKEHSIGREELLIGFQAGSSLEGRRWPPERFAQLADLLAEGMQARILLFGVAAESPAAEQIQQGMRRPDRAVDLTGKTDIGGLIGLVKRCRYLVTNDTGTMHIAAALGVPIVGLFFAHAHPPETGPYAPGHLIFQAHIPCAPCSYGVVCNNVVCIDKVSPELVAATIQAHQTEGAWRLPAEAGDLSEVRAVQTEFDSDHCLRLRPLVRHPLTLTDVFAWAYRRLWLDTLVDAKAEPREDALAETASLLVTAYDPATVFELGAPVSQNIRLLDQLESLGEAGLAAIDTIIRQWNGGGAQAAALQKTAARISELDQQIDLAGLTHPEIKPVTDLFNKRKENIDGEDVLSMAQATKTCYRKLLQECRGLRKILNGLMRALEGHAACGEAGAVSIKMDVPGR